MSEKKFPETESFSPSVKRTWSWRHREGASVDIDDPNSALLELLTLEEEQNDRPDGLTSQEAYKRLVEVIREELQAFNFTCKARWTKDIWTTLNSNPHSSVSWTSIVFFLFELCALIITYGALPEKRSSLPFIEGLIVFLIAVANVVLCVREESLRRREVYESTKSILENCAGYCNWNPPDYIDPCTPSSPSISLTHVYRDGELVNVPCNLLVHGDIIVLGPSQSAPACVELIENTKYNAEDASNEQQQVLVLEKGEMYNPDLPSSKSTDDTAHPCQPKPRKMFIVKEAPFKATLNFLLKNSSNRPVSILENEKHFIASTIIEKRFLLILLGLLFLINITRFLLLTNGIGHWSEMVLLLQGYVILPLLPLSFPILWISINLYSASRIKILFDKLRENSQSDTKVLKNFPVRDVLPLFWKTFIGDPSYLPRTSNLLQVLGNITVWCCIDKDGILSLPNPSVEKVFFLQSKKSVKQRNTLASRDRKISSCTWESSDVSRQTSRDEGNNDDTSSSSSDDDDDYTLAEDGSHLKGRAAVLNITTDPDSQFGLRFDDKRWPEYLSSLKPLGLNILLNSPCACPVRAMRFVDHTAHLSLSRNPSPVLNPRRCLCLLGKEIGFTEQALNLFSKKQHIVVVHSLDTPVADCPLQSSSYLAVCKERPVPAMVSLIVKEAYTGSHQLLSQGTPDLVLDACTDFWDGSSLNTITSHDKKKVLDFYQRNSMSSQCVAFAYRPCTEVSPEHTPDVFLRLPSIYQWKSSESVSDSVSEQSNDDGEGGMTFKFDDLSHEDIKLEQLLEEVPNIEDSDTYHKLLGGQVFIGMLTLQYQAIKDIIPLVEDLNKAGIRFVHFSPENELKSRVFAERMGLETGWNCHISLSENGTQCTRSKTESSSNEQQGGAGAQVIDVHEHDGDEKHVSWIDIDIKTGSNEKVGRSETGASAGESEKSERTTLLGDEQNTANDDYWFFYNRAKLPRGIDNIRPHLDNIDNVPLLVPLFTDCTPQAVKDMIAIMQEYGEVVCCVGSSFNVNNTSIFTQADVSVCIEPLFPQLCLKGLPKDFRSGTPQLQGYEKTRQKLKNQESMEDNETDTTSEMENVMSPLELSALMNSLPCALSFPRNIDFKFKSLLKEARRLSFGVRKCFTFILTCQLMLSMVMFLSSCLLLPPPLTGLHLLWLSCFTVPLLSISLIASKPSKGLMSLMTGRNDHMFEDITYPFCMYFGCGFLPTCFFICVVLFPLTLHGFCTMKNANHSDQCHLLLGYRNTSEPWNGLGGQYIQVLALAQDLNAFSLVLFFAIISTSFVHRLKSLWRRSPFSNRHWLYSVIVVVGSQLLYFIISQSIWIQTNGSYYNIKDLPPYILTLVFLWPLGSLVITELLKRRYIKLYVRFQKRAKLKFGTKLGMNSPF